ncbi:hypothetical protein M8818_000561 [Zalaria obscura]|uniref:Uncharacterized protein n=1 Tax=Zalaria obscura TaxID=2024903 RepID=A0ACC3SPU5_9PEZI
MAAERTKDMKQFETDSTMTHEDGSARYPGLSKSVMAQIKAGVYTPEQIETLMAQRANVIKMIANDLAVHPSTRSPTLPTPYNVSSASIFSSPVKESNKSAGFDSTTMMASRATCEFKCCTHCRPFLRERAYTSFEAVMYNEEPPLNDFEARRLHVVNAEIARGFGLRTVRASRRFPLSESMESLQIPTDGQPSTEHESPTTDPSSGDESWISSESSGSSSGDDHRESEITRTPPAMHTLRRVSGTIASSSPRSTSSTSTVSLPTPATNYTPDVLEHEHQMKALPYRLKDDKDSGIGSEIEKQSLGYGLGLIGMHQNGSSSSVGSEVEVDGGVALTEEAVGRHTPDIITQV